MIQLPQSKKLATALKHSGTAGFTFYASITAFCLYTCIYAFRKSFSAATFDGLTYAGINYKVWLVTFQVLGYGAAKFFGIKYIAELKPGDRTSKIFLMVIIAGLSWLFFAWIPAPYNIIFLFVNGFPLGLVWGMVFGFLEGRRVTEALGASLSVSFIFSAGLCRSVGAYLMQSWNVSEMWMPFASCLVFLVPFLLFLWLIDHLPSPSSLDEAHRTKRAPMDAVQRRRFVATFLPGIILFVLAYMLLTTFRDFRENFAADVWQSLGYGGMPGIYAKTETPVTIFILLIIGSLMFIRNNKKALMINHYIIASGMLLIGAATLMFERGFIDPPLWMILIGIGLYLGYVPFNSIFFERLLASFQYIGTVGFIMYIADAFGYLGSVSVLFIKEFSFGRGEWVTFFISGGYFVSGTGTILILASALYFYRKKTPAEVTASGTTALRAR